MGGWREHAGKAGLVGAVAVAGIYATRSSPPPVTAVVAPKGRPNTGMEEKLPEAKWFEAHVVGTVRKPGVIRFPSGERVHDVIKRAGGVLPGTDMAPWNLAKKVPDGEYLRFARPERVATRSVTSSVAQTARRSRSRPMPLSGNIEPLSVTLPPAGNVGAPVRASREKPEPSVVSLNTGSAGELDGLPGIGPAMAGRILAYRSEHGGFTSFEELLAVPGIGPKKLARMRPYLRL